MTRSQHAPRSTLVSVCALALVGSLTAGCGSEDAVPSGAARTPTTDTAATDEPTTPGPGPTQEPTGKAAGVATRLGPGDPRPEITCPGEALSHAVFDSAQEARGEPTPEAAVQAQLRRGETFVLSENGRRAWLLRGDGTARTRLGLVRQRGWLVSTADGC